MTTFKPAFNGKVDISAAMNWNQSQVSKTLLGMRFVPNTCDQQVLALFDAIKAKPADYGVESPSSTSVSTVVDSIRTLV